MPTFAPTGETTELSDREFQQFRAFIHEAAGISLSPNKKALVSGRLEKRLRERRLASYADYLDVLRSGYDSAETQLAIDLLTTNETYFFREPQHFELLREMALAARREGRPLRVWSAACSSGEEPYSIAMVLADCQGDLGWEVLASDISTRMLARARTGHYPEARTEGIPTAYRQRYCLRGTGPQEGTLLVQRALRERVRFMQINLDRPLPGIGSFDLVFLRNVMIYFAAETKRSVVARLVQTMKPGGQLFIGHSESLHDLSPDLRALAPSVYCRP
ncbi:protein-glutamate O-methyltransferase CheR [Ideonella sp.]|uniref:CheR family methyltransferase n=1 Tax=Ideonella sp. TaxID=1929293 RepID=UPI0035B1DC68